ncbi:hypothetical protein, partial [Acinetobacter bereziniae]|uniref:hypothetical protein n=2 Tax=Moraxellaceae TaxID=468 RepID=UPI001C2EC726
YGNTFIIMNAHICQLMVNHLNLNNDKDFAFLLIKSIKNGSITKKIKMSFKSLSQNSDQTKSGTKPGDLEKDKENTPQATPGVTPPNPNKGPNEIKEDAQNHPK